jgi:hypothetical protein
VEEVTAPVACYPCAPGAENARATLRGEPAAMGKELLFVVERCGLVGLGLWVAGARKSKLLVGALAGGLAVELFVLGYAHYLNGKSS